METNTKSPEKRFSEYQYVLNCQRKYGTWALIVVLAILIPATMVIYRHTGNFSIIAIDMLFGVMVFWKIVKIANTSNAAQELSRKINAEDGYIKSIKADYDFLKSKTFGDIPQPMYKTAKYLLSGKEIGPNQVIKNREDELANLKIKCSVYLSAPQKTFWQYLLSWKWLKKIPAIALMLLIIIVAGCKQKEGTITGQDGKTYVIADTGTVSTSKVNPFTDYHNGVYYYKIQCSSRCPEEIKKEFGPAISKFRAEHKGLNVSVTVNINATEKNFIDGYWIFTNAPCYCDTIK